jgi:hypothetical protein
MNGKRRHNAKTPSMISSSEITKVAELANGKLS